jgi:hypothetical protein
MVIQVPVTVELIRVLQYAAPSACGGWRLFTVGEYEPKVHAATTPHAHVRPGNRAAHVGGTLPTHKGGSVTAAASADAGRRRPA